MPRYGKQKKAASFDDLVDAVGGNLAFLARADVRARAHAQGLSYPDDFEEALEEYYQENPERRPKGTRRAATTRPKAAPRSRGAGKVTARSSAAMSGPKPARKRAPSSTGASRTTRKASVPKPKAPRTRSGGTSATQLRRGDKIDAYSVAINVVSSLRASNPGTLTALRNLRDEWTKRREKLYATHKRQKA